jgi:hypothetical protein
MLIREREKWVEAILKAIGIEKMSLTDKQLSSLEGVIESIYFEGEYNAD